MFGFGKGKIDATANLVEKTGNFFDKLFTSDEERDAGKIVMQKISQRPGEWAHELNVISAQSTSWFNSGWRPALGWVGAIGLFAFFVPQYIIASYVWAIHSLETQAGEALPAYPVSGDALWQLIVLLLGGKVLRTVEKSEGTAK